MNKKLKSFIAGLSIFTACLSFSGCALLLAGAAGGAGTALWLSGKLSDEVHAPYEKTVAAAKKALSSLDMAIEKETAKDDVTQLISKYKDGSNVWIDIRPLGRSSSKVEIRVGVKGARRITIGRKTPVGVMTP